MGLGAAAAVVMVLLGVLTACGDDAGGGSEAGSGAASAVPIAERCESGVPGGAVVTTSVVGGGDLSLLAAEFDVPEGVEPSGTVMVLLHQTGTLGLCGWGRFATEAAASGVRSFAVDLCGYGGSECADGEGTPADRQVDLAAAHVREEMGADRVVLVGASMGGSRTVMAVAAGAEVDAWADISGPSTWDGTTLADLASDVSARGLPGLVAHAPDDTPSEYAAAQALAAATGAAFLDGDSGHGYELLTDNTGGLRPDGEELLAFVRSAG
jgi:pimeloyl-ACP methyl ester carboxylesterase